MASAPATREAARREALVLSAILLAYSNGLAALAMRRGRTADLAYRWTNPVLLPLVLLGLARARRTGLGSLLRGAGLRRAGWPGALVRGGLGGLALAAPPLLFFARPVLLDAPLEYGPIGGLSRGQYWFRLLVELPLGVALFEELLFRGILFDSWALAISPRRAHLAATLVFTAWHFTVSIDTMQRTNIGTATIPLLRPLQPHATKIGVAGGLLTIGVAGILFNAIRQWSGGNLWSTVFAHWIVDAFMVAALRRRGKPA